MAGRKTTKKAPAKKAATKPAANVPAKKLSQIEAAIQVLAKAGEPMTTKQMVEAMAAKKLWSSPGGKTPAATLYASISARPAEGEERPLQEGRTTDNSPWSASRRTTHDEAAPRLATQPAGRGQFQENN